MHAVLSEAPKQWRAAPLSRGFAEAVATALSSAGSEGLDATARTFAAALVRVWMMQNRMDETTVAHSLHVANSVLTDGRLVDMFVNAETPHAEALLIASDLRHVNERFPLPRRTIAGVIAPPLNLSTSHAVYHV